VDHRVDGGKLTCSKHQQGGTDTAKLRQESLHVTAACQAVSKVDLEAAVVFHLLKVKLPINIRKRAGKYLSRLERFFRRVFARPYRNTGEGFEYTKERGAPVKSSEDSPKVQL
jgi:hypothetical protein